MSSTAQQVGIDSLRIVTLVVEDQESAVEFYTETLGFEVKMDGPFEMDGETGRWVTVGPPGQEVEIALVTPDERFYDEPRRQHLSSQLGIETGWTFTTADCEESVAALKEAGVAVTQEPTEYEWGIEARVADPDGNEFGLFEFAGL